MAYYPFNNNANDESGNGNHGTNYGAALSTDRFGTANSAYSFNRNYIEIPNSSSLQSPVNSLTVSFWTYITQWDAGFAAFLAKSNTASQGQYGSAASSVPYIQFDLGGQYLRFTKTLSRNIWYFICYKWDGQKIRYYINGAQTDSASFTGPFISDSYPLQLGRHTSGTAKYLRGKLDDVRIYKRALTDSEILNLSKERYLNIKIIPQGFYNTLNSKLNKSDTVRIYLRESVSPFRIADSSKAVIDSVTFQGTFRFFVNPGSYYIVLNHRNSIETWSNLPFYIDETNYTYDFTTSYSQAYGNNLFFNGSRYCIFGGDVNQDETVDASDLSSTENDAYISAAGYLKTDITGDNYTDASDVSIVENNAVSNVSSVSPLTNLAPCSLSCERFISWSGFLWCVRSSNETKCYPGPNYYSGSSDNVRVDSSGDLHLRITKRNGKFYCAELFTVEAVSYGLYTFYVTGRLDTLDRNIVAGIFTWNDKNCLTNANSEIDIEFTRWGKEGNPDVIEYSVQPANGGNETERFTSWPLQYTGNNTVHFMNWTPNLIYWSSYKGHTNPPSENDLISYWSFNTNNPPKSSENCNSNPIIIPDPEDNTQINLNFWLNHGSYPSDNAEAEIIIHRLEYLPEVYAR
ncbi:MAG: hypothetical protein JNJ56_03460 [Ignavibacteria bacterium]|nr:hypothetical protein [Ignavibacteria bacterium]